MIVYKTLPILFLQKIVLKSMDFFFVLVRFVLTETSGMFDLFYD